MAKYKCNVCGYVYDEEAAKAPFSSLTQCQVCGTAKSSFSPLAADEEAGARREGKRQGSCPILLNLKGTIQGNAIWRIFTAWR